MQFFKRGTILKNVIYKCTNYDSSKKLSHGVYVRIFFEFEGKTYWEDGHIMKFSCDYSEIYELYKTLEKNNYVQNTHFPKIYHDHILQELYEKDIKLKFGIVQKDLTIENGKRKLDIITKQSVIDNLFNNSEKN